MEMTKNELKSFRTDFTVAVSALEKRFGVKIELGNISYNQTSFTTRLTCTNLAENGEKAGNAEMFNMYKTLYGLKANLGDSYKDYKGLTYTIMDINPRRTKYPLVVKCSDGKRYKVSVDMVNMYMSRKMA